MEIGPKIKRLRLKLGLTHDVYKRPISGSQAIFSATHAFAIYIGTIEYIGNRSLEHVISC